MKNDFALTSKAMPKNPLATRDERTSVDGWNARVFTDDVISLSSDVEDSSSHGAGLVLPKGSPQLIETNVELTLTINTGAKEFTRKAIVRWVDNSQGEIRFGVQYIEHAQLIPSEHQLQIENVRVDPSIALKIPSGIAMRRKVLPFVDMKGVVHIACADSKNLTILKSVERILKSPTCVWEVDAKKLEHVLRSVYGNDTAALALPKSAEDKKKEAKEQEGNEAVDLAEDLLYAAYIREASDIHVDPHAKGARIRFRVDGQLEVFQEIKQDSYVELSSRLKVIAGLDIAEKRAPQDGRFTHQFAGGQQHVDIRAATLPTKYGERITMRLLGAQNDSLTLAKLGFVEHHQYLIENFLKRIQGMMVLTGPTGSGKTTTLYASMTKLLKTRAVNIMTVEDPIEYEIAGAAQCEIDANSDKVSFNSALRSILRHDPDVVMVGEIRDKETADIAIKAALTGHMVLSTLHTNSAIATITRLVDMGVAPYLVAAALRVVIAQRLLRRLCGYCRISRPMTELEAISLERVDLTGSLIYEPAGCIYCSNKGYKGRIGLYELVELRTEWAKAVAEGARETDLLEMMEADGIKTLLNDGVDKLLAGDTSYSEVLQVASSW